MSKFTWERIPPALAHSLHVYQVACERTLSHFDVPLRYSLERASDRYTFFHKNKLMNPGQNEMNREHFDPMVAEVLAPITREPLRLEGVEALSVDEIMAKAGFDSTSTTGFSSTKPRNVRNTTDFQANIINSFASACTPLQNVPPIDSALRSFLWYRKLLAVSPIVIFLRQKQRLFADSTIQQTNFPYGVLQSAVSRLASNYAYSDLGEQRLHNYHLTNIASTDLFRLASLASNIPDGQKWQDSEIWAELQAADPLSDKLREAQMPTITETHNPASKVELTDKTLTEAYPLAIIRERLLRGDAPLDLDSVFPYDVHYSDIYSLSIEHPVLRENHDTLLNILEKQSEIEIAAVRLNTAYPEINDGLTKAIESSKGSGFRSQSMNYEQMLKRAQQAHGDQTNAQNGNHMASFISRLGKLGLIHVEETVASNAIVLMG